MTLSSPTRDRTHAPAAEERSPNHWDTRNVGRLVSSEASSLPFRCWLLPVSLCPHVPHLQRPQSYGLEPTLVTSFYFDHLCEAPPHPISKYSHILKFWG